MSAGDQGEDYYRLPLRAMSINYVMLCYVMRRGDIFAKH